MDSVECVCEFVRSFLLYGVNLTTVPVMSDPSTESTTQQQQLSDPEASPPQQTDPVANPVPNDHGTASAPAAVPNDTVPAATAPITTATKPRRVIRRRRQDRAPAEPAVDPVILQKLLKESCLPAAYSFEIPKTVQRVNALKATHIALQMPEGLLMYSTVLADLYQRVVPTLTQVSVLGDVTYGACCVDDLGAKALGADLLVHFGHSCLVPLQHTVIPCLYVFVEIQMDIPHMVDCLHATLLTSTPTAKPHVYLLGTVQFRHAFVQAELMLKAKGYNVSIPQAKPLSPGEVLGCTSPSLHAHEQGTDDKSNNEAIVCFVADGRFHLESTLISNPHIQTFYRYDPYSKTLTEEEYAHEQMKSIRKKAVDVAATTNAKTFGILLGTLGRQGNPAIVQRIQKALRDAGKRHFLVLLSEITPLKLSLLDANNTVDAWVQVACPRLSVDWGHSLSQHKPVLSPYELFCALEHTEWRNVYPMDYYSFAGGPWSNYYEENKDRKLLSTTTEQTEATATPSE